MGPPSISAICRVSVCEKRQRNIHHRVDTLGLPVWSNDGWGGVRCSRVEGQGGGRGARLGFVQQIEGGGQHDAAGQRVGWSRVPRVGPVHKEKRHRTQPAPPPHPQGLSDGSQCVDNAPIRETGRAPPFRTVVSSLHRSRTRRGRVTLYRGHGDEKNE